MRKLLKNSLNYAFSIIPLLAVFFVANSGKAVTDSSSKASKGAGLNKTAIANPAVSLPCGFVATGPKQKPETPTFTTNNEVPILQYPAGGYPGTSAQIPDVVYSEKQNDQLILQSDGNLVIYCTSCTPTKPIWSSQTNGKDGRTLFFQKDGELVLHNSKGKIIWRFKYPQYMRRKRTGLLYLAGRRKFGDVIQRNCSCRES